MLFLAVITCLVALPMFVGNAGAFAGVSTYWIGTTKYHEVNLTEIRLLPFLPPALKVTLGLLSRCHAGVEVFIESPIRNGRGGIVLYTPTSVSACLTSTVRSAAATERSRSKMPGAIGTPSSFRPCKRHFRAAQGNGLQKGVLAFVAATDLETCERLSTEVPGGLPVSVGTIQEFVKAQAYDTRGRLLDYVTPMVPLPATLHPQWLLDNGTWGPRLSVPLF